MKSRGLLAYAGGQNIGTDAWQEVFLRLLGRSRHIGQACQAAGISRQTAYETRKAQPAFAAAWDAALEYTTDTLEATGYKRALEGSDMLLWNMLKSQRRAIYGDRLDVAHGVDPQTVGLMADLVVELQRRQLPELGEG